LVRQWCTLDASGRVTLTTPRMIEAGEIRVLRIRPGEGAWRPAAGAIEVVR
jgi:hypothetical protein